MLLSSTNVAATVERMDSTKRSEIDLEKNCVVDA